MLLSIYNMCVCIFACVWLKTIFDHLDGFLFLLLQNTLHWSSLGMILNGLPSLFLCHFLTDFLDIIIQHKYNCVYFFKFPRIISYFLLHLDSIFFVFLVWNIYFCFLYKDYILLVVSGFDFLLKDCLFPWTSFFVFFVLSFSFIVETLFKCLNIWWYLDYCSYWKITKCFLVSSGSVMLIFVNWYSLLEDKGKKNWIFFLLKEFHFSKKHTAQQKKILNLQKWAQYIWLPEIWGLNSRGWFSVRWLSHFS